MLEDRIAPAVNQAPFGIANTVTTLEDTPAIVSIADFGFSDPDSHQFAGATLTNLNIAGSFTNNGVAVQNGDFVSASDILAGLLILTPTPDANGAGLAWFDFQVRDDGGTADDGVDTDPTPRTMTFDVTPVNDAPSFSAANPPTVDANPDLWSIPGWATFNPGGGPDEAGQTALYTVTNVSNPDLFAVSPMVTPDGTLQYAVNPAVEGIATFDVQVQDDAGAQGNTATYTIHVLRTVTWTGLGDGAAWDSPYNWSDGFVPGAFHDVIIEDPTANILIGPYANVTVRSLLSHANLTVLHSSLAATTGIIDNRGTLTFDSGADVVLDATNVIRGDGVVNFINSNLAFIGPVTSASDLRFYSQSNFITIEGNVTARKLLLDGGNLVGSGHLTITQEFRWNWGYLVTGTTTVGPAAKFIVGTGGTGCSVYNIHNLIVQGEQDINTRGIDLVYYGSGTREATFNNLGVRPAVPAPFDATAAAATLHGAMDGLGTDEDLVWNTLDGLYADERIRLAIAYQTQYGKSLHQEFLDEFSDNILFGNELQRTLELYYHGGMPYAYAAVYTDPLGNRTTFLLDEAGRLVREIDPLGNSTYYRYTAAGQLASRSDRLGRMIALGYDADGRLASETWIAADRSTVADVLTFTYSTAGELWTASNAFGSYTFTWINEQLMSVTNPFNVTLAFGYDADGHRNWVADSLGGLTTSTYTGGLLATRQFTDGAAQNLRVNLSYNPDGWLTDIARFSDLAATQLVATTQYAFAAGQLASITHRDSANAIIDFFNYAFDTNGLLATIDSQSAGSTTYGYDALGQVVSESSSLVANSFTFDANGNRAGTGYVIGAGNRLLSDGVWNYTYDAEGNTIGKVNITTGESWSYAYDHRNHMTHAEQRAADGSLVMAADYRYDAFSNRIEKSVTTGGATVVTRYVLDGFNPDKLAWVGNENWDVHAELDGNGSLTTRYVHGDAVDEVFARIDAGETRWLLTDHLQSVRAVLDGVGTVLDRIAYDAFGNITYQLDPSLGNFILFTSRQFDAETGFYFNRARYLDPFTGRWTTQDPVGFLAGDSNLYRNVFNSPTSLTDPSGNSAQIVIEGVRHIWRAFWMGVDFGPPGPVEQWIPVWGPARLIGAGIAQMRAGNVRAGDRMIADAGAIVALHAVIVFVVVFFG